MNKKLKRLLAAALCLLLITGIFAGCGGKENSSAESSEQSGSSSSEASAESSEVSEDGRPKLFYSITKTGKFYGNKNQITASWPQRLRLLSYCRRR